MSVLPALILPALLAQIPAPTPVPAPDPTPYFKCTLTLKGTMRIVTQGKNAEGRTSVEQRTETFNYRIPGWLKENAYAQGPVVWEFYPSHDPASKTTGRLDMAVQTPEESVKFTCTQPTPYGSFAFFASSRGRAISAVASMAITGTAQVTKAGVTITEERTFPSLPLPNVKKGDNDYSAPTLQFTGSSLWTLPNARGPFDARATITYAHGKDGLRADGKVDVGFQLDPSARSATPK